MQHSFNFGLSAARIRIGDLPVLVRLDVPMKFSSSNQAVVHLGGAKRLARAVYGAGAQETDSALLFTRPHDVNCAPSAALAIPATPAFVLKVTIVGSSSTAAAVGIVHHQFVFPRLFDFAFIQRLGHSVPQLDEAQGIAAWDDYTKFRAGPLLDSAAAVDGGQIQSEDAYEQWTPPRWYLGEFGEFPSPRCICKQRVPINYK